MRYCDKKILLPVTELCVTALRCGSLDLRSAPFGSERLLQGVQAHRRLQAARLGEHSDYTSEVRLSCELERGGLFWNVSGQADGIYTENGLTVVEEIKTVKGRFPTEPDVVHLAQLRVYAYFLCKKHGIGNVKAVLTYYNIVTEKVKSFELSESDSQLEAHFFSLLDRLIWRAKLIAHRHETLLPSVREGAEFPYAELRLGQKELLNEVYRTVKGGKLLFAQAPTGIGKTLSVLYPSMRALSEGYADRIFYLTAKASTRREALSAAKSLYERGARLRTCVITARDGACINEKAKTAGRVSSYCNPADCPYANGYYDKLDTALLSLLSKRSGFFEKAIMETAREFEVCPYELSLDLSELCDVIICDYNYAFDAGVYLRRYFAPDAPKSDSVFLIDEAHNLPDRARDMYSCQLLRSDFEAVYASSGEGEKELDSALESIIRFLRGLRRLCRDNIIKTSEGERGFYMSQAPIEALGDALGEFLAIAEAWRRERRDHPLYEKVSALTSDARKYLQILEYYDDKFLTYVELLGGDTRVRVFCLDPSGVIGERMAKARSAVLFSATLTPIDYFQSLCGAGADTVTLDLPSPFPPENLCVAAVDSISTRADDRDDRSCRKIASYIAAAVSAKAGNYICYFPSYSFMDKVVGEFTKKYPKVDTVVQRQGMTHTEREDFLAAFKADKGILRIGFCVLGGSFSEGVDLPGDRLIGSIVVGVGIPGISNERNILRDYYDLRTERRGYDYAYSCPGMNSVLQAAGRVIRTDRDRGVVILIDDRYSTPQYVSMLPEQWNGIKFAGNPNSLAKIVRNFWEGTK